MSSNKETPLGTILFVLAVCLVCAALVSISAVGLKDKQDANKLLDQQTKVLEAAKLIEKANGNIVETYNKYVDAKMIDLDSGEFIDSDPLLFDERRNSRDKALSTKPENDLAGISRRSNTAVVYLVKNKAGAIDTVVLPIVGSGLWNLMFGYVGLEADLNTVNVISFCTPFNKFSFYFAGVIIDFFTWP